MNLPGPELELDESGVPIVYARALLIYDYMLGNLETSVYEDKYQQYKGKITDELYDEFGITQSQYSRSMKLLKEVGAVEQVGRSNEGSHWILFRRPELEQFSQLREERYKSKRRPTKHDVLMQRIGDLIDVVAQHENRIASLERHING
ncbi:MAG: hypothetical protein LC687_00565 [Actinobacteria bacterium]|nr:hypothetical protein [Actinomycetota bacterium]MCA1806359.1 hypothetical protein [Actinomycetota bacterium]